MRRLFLAGALACSLLAEAQVNDLPRSQAMSEGISDAAVTAFYDALTTQPKNEIHGVMILRHGKVVGELHPAPFKAEYQHTLYSCSKTFVSAAVGIAIHENRLRLTDRVGALLADKMPAEVSAELASMTVRDLLVMGAGIEPDWVMRNEDTDWLKVYLAKPVSTPGEKFQYDSMCTYLLSAIVQRVTGLKTLDYLKQKVFADLHITQVGWEESKVGINTGGWGLYLQTESLAKFGQLLLQHGQWQGRQLIPAEWVDEMMKKQADDGGLGYGYQIWMCAHEGTARADGAYGQYIYVIPDKDMVVVITECNTGSSEDVHQQVWKLLESVDVPAAAATKSGKAKDYVLPVVKGKASGNAAKLLEGKTIALPANDFDIRSMRPEFGKNHLTLHIVKTDGTAYDIACGYQAWETTWTQATPPYSIQAFHRYAGIEGPFGVAASYAWKNRRTLEVKVHYVNWITSLDITLEPADDGTVAVGIKANYATEGIELQGTM